VTDVLRTVGEVAHRFDIAVSTLHYWERRGLITPHRRSGRRWYDADQMYRIALIRAWQEVAHMSLHEIAVVLAGRTATHDWRDTVTDRLAAIEAQAAELDTARRYLNHMLQSTSDNPSVECEQYRAEIKIPEAGQKYQLPTAV
jgi:DNA-binding transcriptional MerR regulator